MHRMCAPYHPASNGLAERFVQLVKPALKVSVSHLHRDCTVSSWPTGNSTCNYGSHPCSLFLGRSVQTCLDLLKPNWRSHILSKQSKQKEAHNCRAHDWEWFLGQSVMVRNLRPGADWVKGVIVEWLGPPSHLIKTENHHWKCYTDQLKVMDEPPLREPPLLKSTEFES